MSLRTEWVWQRDQLVAMLYDYEPTSQAELDAVIELCQTLRALRAVLQYGRPMPELLFSANALDAYRRQVEAANKLIDTAPASLWDWGNAPEPET